VDRHFEVPGVRFRKRGPKTALTGTDSSSIAACFASEGLRTSAHFSAELLSVDAASQCLKTVSS
jgi:hypothetical protein